MKLMFRWVRNRLAGRKFHRRECLQALDVHTLIAQMAGNNAEKIRIDFNDCFEDFYRGLI